MANETVTMSKEDLEKMMNKLLNQTRTSAVSGTAETKVFSSTIEAATKNMNPFTAGMSMLSTVTTTAASALTRLEDTVKPNLNTFRELSKTGASFNNDIIGMVAAQKGMRLEMNEFSDIMKTNASAFSGLGGSVTRGAEAFARLSSEFMDSDYIDQLKQAGYSNKELNDVLALQLNFQRATYRDDKESRKEAIESATALAREMDLQAKLTGKSREEQMDNMRKQKEDMQIEAKLRQIGLEKGPEAEAAARKEFAKQMNEAQLRGTEQLFKESILYGQAVSKEAAMQSITAGNSAFQAQVEQGRAFARGEYAKASEMSAKASVEIVAFQRTSASNQLAMLPVQNELTASQHRLMKANQSVYDAMAQLRNEADMKGKSDKELYAEARRRVEEAQRGKDAEGKDVSGATKAIINLGSRVGDVEAAMYKGLVVPINERVSPALTKFAQDILGRTVIAPGAPNTTFTRAVEKEIEKGAASADQPIEGSFRRRTREEPSPIMIGGLVRDVATGATEASKKAAEGVEAATKKILEKRGRASGSLGATGNLFEEFGDGTLMMLHGKEAVVTEDQMKNLMKGLVPPTKAPTTATPTPASVVEQITKMPQPELSTAKTTLDDVVASLNQLNNKMSQLIDTHVDLGSKQIRATKSNNANLFER